MSATGLFRCWYNSKVQRYALRCWLRLVRPALGAMILSVLRVTLGSAEKVT